MISIPFLDMAYPKIDSSKLFWSVVTPALCDHALLVVVVAVLRLVEPVPAQAYLSLRR